MNSQRIYRPASKWLFFLLAVSTANLRADTHDDIVYQRYSRKVTPGKIPYEFDMKFTELTRPATQEDVEKGRAVFTFQGLGPSRVWKLPRCPTSCEWPALKDFPFEGQPVNGKTHFDDFGNVCQAEELQINGQWKRYFGFVCKHGVAVVPAQEICLSFEDCCCDSRTNWTSLPGCTDLGMLGPTEQIKSGIVVSNALKPGDPLPVELFVRNRRGVASPVLGPVYRAAPDGGPAFRHGIRLSLEWAPFKPKNPDWDYPHMNDFQPVSAIRAAQFTEEFPGPVLATGESQKHAAFDLRDWFNISSPGYYRYHFEFNPAELGLPADEDYGPRTYMSFVIGSEPRRLTPEEFNRDIPAFGGAAEAERVRELIKRALPENETRQSLKKIVKQLPRLNHTPMSSDNGPPDEAEVVGLWIANEDLLKTLNTNALGRQKFEALMDKETSLPMKLLLASQAAPLGSRRAALFLFDCMTNTDCTIAENTCAAVRFAFDHYEQNPPDWLVEIAIAALSDERYETGLEEKGWSRGTFHTLSSSADDLTRPLGYLHCTNAVPFLIDMTKKTRGRSGPVWALGAIGDPRAIPILIDVVKQKCSTTKLGKQDPLDGDFSGPIEALGDLRAKEAVPVLLQYIAAPIVIETLERIGDPRIIQPLQALIASKGRVDGTNAANDPELERQRLVASRIAVASLAPENRTAQLCALFFDPSFDQYDRRTIVWRLGDHPDPHAIPFLARAIKTDSSGAVVNQSITVLAVFKYKAAVDALINSLDADFTGKTDWKRAYNPEMYRNNIAESLTRLTGQKIGANKQQWLNWWQQHHDTTPGLN